MLLKIVNTGSQGNCYVLESSTKERLVIELGVHFNDLLKAIDFDLKSVSGCLSTHSHLDHSKSVPKIIEIGIPVYCNFNSKATKVVQKQEFQAGSFKVLAFELTHDVPCLGFLIHHPECGNVLFATDTIFVKQRFANLNQIIIEANYSEEILSEMDEKGIGNQYVKDRVRFSHMSIENCLKVLERQNLNSVQNIVLIHLSDARSDAQKFKQMVVSQTGINTTVAEKNMVIKFNKTPF